MTITLNQYQAGVMEKGYKYTYFKPKFINEEWSWSDNKLNTSLQNAAVRLGELKSLSKLVPDIRLFTQLHVTKEAVLSSRIEGTQTSLNEALLPVEEIALERKDDWKEVNNYIEALNVAISQLETLPISSRLICDTHRILMRGARGEKKQPGRFRESQNCIGGHNLLTATFIPPHEQYVDELMSDLDKFLNNSDINVPELIRIAIAHYQFETIHPFLDGNGRIGRLLITLYLVESGILEQPLLYMSRFFEKDRQLYYDMLTKVRTENDIKAWLIYFLDGIESSAANAIKTLTRLLALKEDIDEEIQLNFGRRAANASKLISKLYVSPIINVDKAAKYLDTTFRPANALIRMLCEKQYLKEVTGQSRNRLFVFSKYLDIFDEESD